VKEEPSEPLSVSEKAPSQLIIQNNVITREFELPIIPPP